ncbi:MAG TPA: hypothetical protein VGM88_00215 [Kofleriaceae bacterium]|jgi:hypothetical protein
MPDEDEDKRVKDLLGSATPEDLERWFGLPSYQALAEDGVVPPEVAEAESEQATQRAQALAAAEPAFYEPKFARGEKFATALVEPEPWKLFVAEDGIALFDEKAQHTSISTQTREYELPDGLQDRMSENAPQALLRDLHRPESMYEKWFQLVDMAAAQRMDIVAVIAKALRTNLHVTLDPELPTQALYRELREVRAERRASWLEVPAHQKAMAAKLAPEDAQAVQDEAAAWTAMSSGGDGP